MSHDKMKILREKINAGYINSKAQLLENLERVFSEHNHPEYRGLFRKHQFVESKEEKKKSLLVMYNKLYDKV